MRIAPLAGISGFSAVALGAFGAHALRPHLDSLGTTQLWHTAVLYHLVHAAALTALALSAHSKSPTRPLRLAALAWTVGILLFSGSLYVMALGSPRWVGAITPIGGLCFLVGWACLTMWGYTRKENSP